MSTAIPTQTQEAGARGVVRLTLDWPMPPEGQALRWTLADFRKFRDLALAHQRDGGFEANAFQAFRIFRAKNFDLFLDLDLSGVRKELVAIRCLIERLELFERTGEKGGGELGATYLAVRRAVARPSASDERRALWILLLAGRALPANSRTILAEVKTLRAAFCARSTRWWS